MAYNPQDWTIINKPLSANNFPLDGRSYFYDKGNTFALRPYINSAEVLAYLPSSVNRGGQFPIIINTGGTIGTDGKITGGTNAEWWFKDGVTDGDLVLKQTGVTQAYVDGQISTLNSALQAHINNTANPHNVTKTQVGLGNVDNTSDANKPVSTATQTALNAKATDANVLHKTGVETAVGVKTFADNTISKSFQAGTAYDLNQLTQLLYVNGDSITVGLNAIPRSVFSWANLASILTNSTVVNQAISGTTLVKFSNGDNSAIDRLASITPTYNAATMLGYISAYGINDGNNVGGTFNSTNFINAYNTLIDTLTSKGWPANKIYIFIPFGLNPNHATIDGLLTTIASNKGVVKIPVFQYMTDNGGASLLDTDNLHPTDLGHLVLVTPIGTAINGSYVPYSVFNQDLITSKRGFFGKGIYGGSAINGLELHGAQNDNSALNQSRVTIFDILYAKKDVIASNNITYGNDTTGAVTTPPKITNGAGAYANGAITASNLSLEVYFGTGLGVNVANGLVLQSAAGTGGTFRITSNQDHYFIGNAIVGSAGVQTAGAGKYFGSAVDAYYAVAGSLTTTFFRGFGSSGMGFSGVDGVFLITGGGLPNKITFKNDTYVQGDIFGTNNVTIGSSKTGSQTTPSYLAITGNQLSATPGTNLMVRLYANLYGFTVSANSLDYVAEVQHRFMIGTTPVEMWRMTNQGLSNTGSGPLAGLELKPGTTGLASFRIQPGALLTIPLSGVIENDGTDLYYTVAAGSRRTIVNSSRTITAGTGLTGGGDLSANRTFAIDTAVVAPLASPAFTGTPTVPTATAGTNTTQAASTAFVQAAIANKPTIVSPPATSTSTGTSGQLAYDSNYLYYCYGTNLWARIPKDGTF